eukprot:5453341-Amphidinium_carterae.2
MVATHHLAKRIQKGPQPLIVRKMAKTCMEAKLCKHMSDSGANTGIKTKTNVFLMLCWGEPDVSMDSLTRLCALGTKRLNNFVRMHQCGMAPCGKTRHLGAMFSAIDCQECLPPKCERLPTHFYHYVLGRIAAKMALRSTMGNGFQTKLQYSTDHMLGTFTQLLASGTTLTRGQHCQHDRHRPRLSARCSSL